MKRSLEPGTLAIAKARSGNEKIGDAATTYVEQRSCPSSCVFKDGGGCYAEDGPVGKFVTIPLNRAAAMFVNATPEEIAQAEADAIDRMPLVLGFPLRLHTVGDCKTDEAARIVAAASARYVERGGGRVWSYTHAWRDVPREAWGSVHILASCETSEDVEEAHARGYATSIVVPEFASRKVYEQDWERGAQSVTPGDGQRGTMAPSGAPLRVLPCPAQTTVGVSCSSCGLCMNSERLRGKGLTIGFAIHGTPLLRRRASMALADPTNPDRKLSSRVLIPRVETELREKLGRRPTNREIAVVLDMSESSVWEMRKSIETGEPTRKWNKSRRGARHGH